MDTNQEHDNGANRAPAKKTRRPTKKELEKTLEAEIKLRSSLSRKLKEVKADNRQLRESMSRISEDADALPRHSTMYEGSLENRSNALLMTSMNAISVASLNIPECKPAENNDEIDRKSFEAWKDLLEASLDLFGVTDETTKMNVVKVKAGLKQLETLDSTPPQTSPDATIAPYSNAMKRLKDYFGSREYSLIQRQKLRSMVQAPGESDTKYVKRVIAAAKLCDFDEDRMAENVAEVIQWHALNLKVREAGRKMMRKGGSLADLLNKVREYEVDKTNEEIFAKNHPPAAEATVAAIVRGQPGGSYQRSGNRSGTFRGSRGGYSGRPVRGGRWQGHREGGGYKRNVDLKPDNPPCWRCTGRYHSEKNCHAIEKICRNCQRVGHLERACQEMPAPITPKRRISDEGECSTRKRVAAVSKEEDIIEKNEVNEFSN